MERRGCQSCGLPTFTAGKKMLGNAGNVAGKGECTEKVGFSSDFPY